LLALNAFCSCHKALGISKPRALIRESAVIFPPITAMTCDHGDSGDFSGSGVVGLALCFCCCAPAAIDHRHQEIISARVQPGSTRAFLL
jgi:hypothetical protein